MVQKKKEPEQQMNTSLSNQPQQTEKRDTAYERMKKHPDIAKWMGHFPEYDKIQTILLFRILEELEYIRMKS